MSAGRGPFLPSFQPLDNAQGPAVGIAFEREQVLPGVRLPAARAFLDDDAVAHGAYAQPGQRHRVGQMAAQLLDRAGDPLARHVGVGERLRRAQDDQVLEREQPGVARTARGRYEAGLDERADRAARQSKELLDVAHTVPVHGVVATPAGGLRRLRRARRDIPTVSRPSSPRAPPAGRAWAACASRRAACAGAFAGAFFSRLARSASMRSMTCAPPSGASAADGDLLALDLLLHRRLDARAHVVGVRGRVELVGGLLLDQLLRELQLHVLDVGLGNVDVLDRPHLGGVEELLHDERVAVAVRDRADHHDVLLAARGPAADRAAVGLAQRLREQRVRLRPALVGREVVGLVEEYRVDGLDRHEFRDVRGVGAGLLQRLQLLGREHHVLVLRELVALDHVLARDRHSSFTQKYCCFTREPQALCRRLNEIARLASVAE